MKANDELANEILDKALELAERDSWEALRLESVAAALGISLADINCCYREKDQLAEAWFDRADHYMLSKAHQQTKHDKSRKERFEQVVLSWFFALSAHKSITREMLAYKLEFGHIHFQARGVTRISRTVQWMREAAGLKATGFARISEEVVLSSAYLTSFMYWLNDSSDNLVNTEKFLSKQLKFLGWPQCWLR